VDHDKRLTETMDVGREALPRHVGLSVDLFAAEQVYSVEARCGHGQMRFEMPPFAETAYLPPTLLSNLAAQQLSNLAAQQTYLAI